MGTHTEGGRARTVRQTDRHTEGGRERGRDSETDTHVQTEVWRMGGTVRKRDT